MLQGDEFLLELKLNAIQDKYKYKNNYELCVILQVHMYEYTDLCVFVLRWEWNFVTTIEWADKVGYRYLHVYKRAT